MPEGRLDQVGPEPPVFVGGRPQWDTPTGDAEQIDIWVQRYNKLLTLHNDRLRELSEASAALKRQVETFSNEIASLNGNQHVLEHKLDDGFEQINLELINELAHVVRTDRIDALEVQLVERQREFSAVHDQRFAELANRLNKQHFQLDERLTMQADRLTRISEAQQERFSELRDQLTSDAAGQREQFHAVIGKQREQINSIVDVLAEHAITQSEQYRKCMEHIGVLQDDITVLIYHATKPSTIEQFMTWIKGLFR